MDARNTLELRYVLGAFRELHSPPKAESAGKSAYPDALDGFWLTQNISFKLSWTLRGSLRVPYTFPRLPQSMQRSMLLPHPP